MNYFKSLTKTLIQKVQHIVQDQYIEPITQQQVYSIINRKLSNKKSSHNLNNKSNNKNNFNQTNQILANIDRISLITPQRQFKLIGDDYSFQVINYRIKQLKNKHEMIKQHMIQIYPKNIQCIQQSLIQMEQIKNLQKSKEKAKLLRQKIILLQTQINRTQKITHLNIKLKNIKNILKVCQKLPNIMKMKLYQLKNINQSQIQQFRKSILFLYPNSKQKSLKCIENLQYFIDKVSSENFKFLIVQITQCLAIKFDNKKYQKAIKDFIVSKSSIELQKLIIKLIETQIRDKIEQNIQYQDKNKNILYIICQKYLTILINISKILRWHRYNLATLDNDSQIQEKIRARKVSSMSNNSQKSDQKFPIINLDSQSSIKINTQQIKNYVYNLIDICLKEKIEQILFNDIIQIEQIYELLNLLNRFYQLAFSFSIYNFPQSKNQIKQILLRKCYKLQQKGIKQLNQALSMQQRNQWNRLPVMRNFRHKSLERNIQKLSKFLGIDKSEYLSIQNFKFLNHLDIQQNQHSILIEEVQKKQQNFQLKIFKFPSSKILKSFSNDQQQQVLPQFSDPQVILCQSCLTILNYFDQYLCLYAYIPIEEIRIDILEKMSFFIQYYIYYIFETFLSETYKNYIQNQFKTIDEQYLKVRLNKNYQNLLNLIYKFYSQIEQKQKMKKKESSETNDTKIQNRNNNQTINNSKKQKSRISMFIKKQIKQSRIQLQNTIKVRIIASQSIKFIITYFQYILKNIDNLIENPQKLNNKEMKTRDKIYKYKQFINSIKMIQTQISDIFLTDQIAKTIKIDFIDPIFKKIKWNQMQNTKQMIDYGSIILKHIKQVYDKMRSTSKGQIPLYLVDKIFGFYFKTQLTYMTKIFLNQHIQTKNKGGRNAKITYEKLVDILYEGLIQFLDDKHKYNSSTSIQSSKSLNYQNTSVYTNPLKLTYLKIKRIFPIILQPSWQKCKQMIIQSLKNHQFIYNITISIMRSSQSCTGLSNSQFQQKKSQIDFFISTEILKKNK